MNFNPSSASGSAFRFVFADSMADRLLDQEPCGLHRSFSDPRNHWTIRNAEDDICGHVYPDGSAKSCRGGGGLPWL